MTQFERAPRIVVIGGGIAGLSCAAAVSEGASVTVLEAESQPGYHASGRSAAVYIEPYINATVHALTCASLPHHLAHGAKPIGDWMIADAEHAHLLDDYLETWRPLCPELHEIDPSQVRRTVPILREESVARVVADPHTRALDVHRLLEGYRRQLLANGGALRGNARVEHLERRSGQWKVSFGAETLTADIVVNAAGAWGDAVGQLAGAEPLGLTPYRRTALMIDPGQSVYGWPMVHKVEGGLYFKPDAGVLMVSLVDATASPPCDAQPDEWDLAVLIDRFEAATVVSVQRPGRAWAGLRTFLPDQIPAVGFDPLVPDFFWLVGQGGFGVQTAPAVSTVAAALLTGHQHALADGLDPARFAVAR